MRRPALPRSRARVIHQPALGLQAPTCERIAAAVLRGAKPVVRPGDHDRMLAEIDALIAEGSSAERQTAPPVVAPPHEASPSSPPGIPH